MYKDYNFEFPESRAAPMDNHLDKACAQTYVSNERNRLKQMLEKMMKYYDDNNIAYQCKERAGHSFEKGFDFDPEKMHLQDREFMKAPRESEKPKKKKTPEDDDFIAGSSDELSIDERGASSSSRPPKHAAGSRKGGRSGIGQGSKSSKRSKQTPDVRAMFDSSALDEDGDNASEPDSESDQYEGCEAENDKHRTMDEVSKFSQPSELVWKQWGASAESQFIQAKTGQTGQFYISDNVESKDSLRIHNMLIKKCFSNDSYGRFNIRIKIVNMYLTTYGERDLTWLTKLIATLSSVGKVVSAMPAKNGEFDLIKVKGMQKMNKDRDEALSVYLTSCIEDLPKEKGKEIRALEAEKALVETLHYEYIKPGTCACGCGMPAEVHRCTACKEAFFPLHLRKDDDKRDGLCHVCDLVDQGQEDPDLPDQSPDDVARNNLSPVIYQKQNVELDVYLCCMGL